MRTCRRSATPAFELVQSFFAIIQAGTKLSDDLVAPAFGGAEHLQQFLLADQIILLVCRRGAH
jgi:hypothetical protein